MILSIIIAAFLWFATFVIQPFNFWMMMTFNTIVLSLIAFFMGRPLFKKEDFKLVNIFIGIFSAAVLYGIFFVGNIISKKIIPEQGQYLSAIYNNRVSVPTWLVAGLLFFPIGFGEEIFWRGFIQNKLQKFGNVRALIITTIIYTGIHIPTLNPVLVLAALTCGLFWGYIYYRTGSLLTVLISHMLWDPFIFVIAPMR